MTDPDDAPARDHFLPMLQKPKEGLPCNGCGVCCREQVCELALQVLSTVEAPCPFLEVHEGRFWCGVILFAARKDEAFGAHMAFRLGIGSGCQMEDEA